ncbi:hypothetical protein GSI_11104 [Ganoderma sinense ZZ0214-1]|uniref:Uncharacterized protein n=1 Tax=Ganoderma sinense ZZ0214-1 TaxID=1077348 RepID=A0A2G8RZ99_9APHY|nr:hypothetical protein GSI_11104 [Ganoderma sinense ZZ0214-1]
MTMQTLKITTTTSQTRRRMRITTREKQGTKHTEDEEDEGEGGNSLDSAFSANKLDDDIFDVLRNQGPPGLDELGDELEHYLCLSIESAHAILCLSMWSRAGFVKTEDQRKVAQLDEMDRDASDLEMDKGWDKIDLGKLSE